MVVLAYFAYNTVFMKIPCQLFGIYLCGRRVISILSACTKLELKRTKDRWIIKPGKRRGALREYMTMYLETSFKTCFKTFHLTCRKRQKITKREDRKLLEKFKKTKRSLHESRLLIEEGEG